MWITKFGKSKNRSYLRGTTKTNKMQKAQQAYVAAVNYADIRGKEQKYIVIQSQTGTEKVVINVGQKTFDAVANLLNPKQLEMPLEKPLKSKA